MDRGGTICRNSYILQLIPAHLFQSRPDYGEMLEASLQSAAEGVECLKSF